MGNISSCSSTFGWAFHHPSKPPFSWFVRVTARAWAITHASCQGLGCIYSHPTMDLNEFNCYYLNPLLQKLAKELKTVFLLGDFNIDLLNYEQHKATNEFLDYMVLPYIIQPTRITSHSKSVIDNIFSSYISQEIISGNLTSTISDLLPQFLIAPHIFSNAPNKKSNIFECDWSKFNCEFLTILQ